MIRPGGVLAYRRVVVVVQRKIHRVVQVRPVTGGAASEVAVGVESDGTRSSPSCRSSLWSPPKVVDGPVLPLLVGQLGVPMIPKRRIVPRHISIP